MSAFTRINILAVAAVCWSGLLFGQNPTPALVIVPAANAPQVPAAKVVSTQSTQSNSGIRAALKSMQDFKAANQELLKKQEEVLERLDEMQKAADQLRIFAKRTGG